jgi:hypothetical protein
VPVVQIDDAKVGQGRVGETTKSLTQAYDEYVMKHAERIAVMDKKIDYLEKP